jgi:hypothetical protein
MEFISDVPFPVSNKAAYGEQTNCVRFELRPTATEQVSA